MGGELEEVRGLFPNYKYRLVCVSGVCVCGGMCVCVRVNVC